MSYKQELTQLHQLLAEIRFHTKNKRGLPTSIDDLESYNEVGITSLDLNADIDTQLDAVMTLASDLAATMEAAQPPERPTATTTVSTTEATTEEAMLTDPENSWAITSTEVERRPKQQSVGTDTEGITATSAATSSDGYTPKVIGGYEQETTEDIELRDTSLQQWEQIRNEEEEKPVERWGEEKSDTDSEPETVQLEFDNYTAETAEEKPAETEMPGDKATIPTT